MNHISRRNSIVYDVHQEKTFIFRVDFHYNGQWSPGTHDIVSENASGNSENDDKDKENKAKEHRILRFYSATKNADGYSFTFYSVFIREGQGSMNQ